MEIYLIKKEYNGNAEPVHRKGKSIERAIWDSGWDHGRCANGKREF